MLKEVKECVISLVTEEIAQQVSLSSCDFDKEINEFKKLVLQSLNLTLYHRQE